jgi:hypothetical protein
MSSLGAAAAAPKVPVDTTPPSSAPSSWPSRYSQKARCGVQKNTSAGAIRRAGLIAAPVYLPPAHGED